MQAEQRLHSEIAELQKQWELVSQKLSRLEHDRILESNSEEKFRLEHRIAEVKAERQHIEQQLSDLERQLEQQKNLAKASAIIGKHYSTCKRLFSGQSGWEENRLCKNRKSCWRNLNRTTRIEFSKD